MALTISDTKIDQFYRSLVFQAIMDNTDLNLYEKTIMNYILRKTLHFKKWTDRISMYKIKTDTQMSLAKVRQCLSSLEEKKLLKINHSKGGHTDGKSKWHEFSISDELLFKVFDSWVEEKEELGVEF